MFKLHRMVAKWEIRPHCVKPLRFEACLVCMTKVHGVAKSWTRLSDFTFQGENGNITVEKFSKPYLKQVIKFTIMNYIMWLSIYLLIWCHEERTLPLWSSSQEPRLISNKLTLRDNIWPVLLKTVKVHPKQRKTKKLLLTRCDMKET